MKKKILLIFISLLIIVTTGCGKQQKNKSDKDQNISNTIEIEETGASYVCSGDTVNEEDNYSFGSKYVIYLDENNIVTKINSSEVIESNDQDLLNYYESYLNSNYDKISVYNGYTYNINCENNRLVTNVNIDFLEFNLESYATDYPNVIDYLNEDNKLTKDKVIDYYSSLNVECKKISQK